MCGPHFGVYLLSFGLASLAFSLLVGAILALANGPDIHVMSMHDTWAIGKVGEYA